jgi:outer membrane protein, heavy metal efflux system
MRAFLVQKSRRVIHALAGLAFIAGASAQEPRVIDGAFLDALRAEVRTNHPTLAAAQARVRAAEAGIRGVRLWEDPMAGVSVMAADVEMRRDDGDLMFMADQTLPRRGLYNARRARASAERAVFQAETISAALNLEMMVAQAAVELALADETLLIQSNQLAWIESMAVNARQKLIDPAGNAAEPLRVEGELAQERQRLDALSRRRFSLARQLNTVLGRSVNEGWPALSLPTNATAMSLWTDEIARITAANPMLLALTSTIAAAQADVDVARQERKPIFSVGAESRVYSGGDFRETTVGGKITLPWFNNSVYRANTDRARAQEVAAQRDYEALERRLRSEFIVAYTDAENAARQADTFAKEVIPRAQSAAQATENSWISAKATLLEVLEARRALLNARLEQRRSVAAQCATLETLRSIIPPTPTTNPK